MTVLAALTAAYAGVALIHSPDPGLGIVVPVKATCPPGVSCPAISDGGGGYGVDSANGDLPEGYIIKKAPPERQAPPPPSQQRNDGDN